MAEFAYNNSIHSSTGYTPFFGNTRYHPGWMMLEHQEVSNNPAVEDRLMLLKEIQSKLSGHLLQAQIAYKKAADRHRMDTSLKKPTFQVGDEVWLLRRNVKTTRPCDKLDYQHMDPFVISGQVNDVAFSRHICVFIQSSTFHYWSHSHPVQSQTGLFHHHLLYNFLTDQNMKLNLSWTPKLSGTNYIISWIGLVIRRMTGHVNL